VQASASQATRSTLTTTEGQVVKLTSRLSRAKERRSVRPPPVCREEIE
jgi:hypothetical protein